MESPTVLSKMTVEEEDTIMPINEVMAKPIGIVSSWDQNASFGLRAKRAKSGSFFGFWLDTGLSMETW